MSCVSACWDAKDTCKMPDQPGQYNRLLFHGDVGRRFYKVICFHLLPVLDIADRTHGGNTWNSRVPSSLLLIQALEAVGVHVNSICLSYVIARDDVRNTNNF